MREFSLEFPFAFGKPIAVADFRSHPEDFVVDEDLGFDLANLGEHVYLHIRKRGENTAWVAEQIAKVSAVNVNDVSYAGRKDRHAVTTQWFSVYLPKGDAHIDWTQLNTESVQILSVEKHSHKLRRGDHSNNFFEIRLRNISPEFHQDITQKLPQLFSKGVPNYFGEQRFGNNANNLREAESLFSRNQRGRDSQKRSMILSAARSYLFNLVLAERVAQNNWSELLEGESESFASGPLWGRGRLSSKDDALALETKVLESWKDWCDSLEHVGLSQERRPLVLQPKAASFEWQADDLILRFSLSSGEFATSLLREIAQLKSAVSG